MKRLAMTIALLAPLVLPTTAWAADASPDLAARARHLADALDNGAPLDDAQRARVEALLQAAEQTVTPPVAVPSLAAAGTVGEACFAEAYRYLPRDDARRLCAYDAPVETARCYVEAHRLLAPDRAVQLCTGLGTMRTAVCFEHANRRLDPEQALRLCQDRGTEETAECFEAADRRLDAGQAVELCRASGTMQRMGCFQRAWTHASADDAVKLCKP